MPHPTIQSLSLSGAAHLIGKDRSTIFRRAQAGQFGQLIEIAELRGAHISIAGLEAVFGPFRAGAIRAAYRKSAPTSQRRRQPASKQENHHV
jgi:hypothetical protein